MNNYNPNIHHRRSIRLKGYDYSQAGLYFVTIIIKDRECLFGEISDGRMVLNEYGQMAYNEWIKTPELRPNIELDAFVIMPNHVHGIINITHENGRGVLHTPLINTSGTETPAMETPQIVTPTTGTHTMGTPQMVTPATGSTPTEIPNGNIGISIHLDSLIKRGVCNTPLRSPSQTIGAIIRGYKSSVTKQINILLRPPRSPIWQRNYWEHIIRDEQSYQRISEYIINNPKNWKDDKFHTEL